MTKLEISEPMLVVAENKSTSTFATTVVPYYGSRAPKQSVVETDRIILDMMDDIQATIQAQATVVISELTKERS
ncbi:hypothetical protein MFLAVUS_003025 [Mucor flavus]|uniref:Uncharacterized protein n=1 Tax=Mucor flavus TaxID=439312 RepID=A0ABP9YRW3_9FUNG